MDALTTPIDLGGGGQAQARPQGPQEAIRLLNLHLPKRQAQGAVAPNSLLTGAGGGGMMGGLGGLDTVLQHLMQAFSAPPTGGPAIPSRPGPMPFDMPANIGGGGQAPGGFPQSAQPPQFQGLIDTPPQQAAPPLFDQGGGGGVDPASWMLANFGADESGNVWDFHEAMVQALQQQQRRQQAPRGGAPTPHVVVENPLTGGGPRA